MITVTVERPTGNIIIEMGDDDNINEVLQEHGIKDTEKIEVNQTSALEEHGFSFETGV